MRFLLVTLLLLLSRPLVGAPTQIETSLTRAEDFYARGNYAAAENELAGLKKAENGLAKTEKARLYLLQARLEFVFNDGANAQPILEKLHAVQPETELDPVKDPPLALKMWAHIKDREVVRKPAEHVTPTHKPTEPPAIEKPSKPTPWALYALLAVPTAVAVTTKSKDTRNAALGFTAGVLVISVTYPY